FRTDEINTDGATIHVRVGGEGPAGHVGAFGDGARAPVHGRRPGPARHGSLVLLDAFSIQKADVVTHDIGNMLGYAFAGQYPDRVVRFVLMDAPLPFVLFSTATFGTLRPRAASQGMEEEATHETAGDLDLGGVRGVRAHRGLCRTQYQRQRFWLGRRWLGTAGEPRRRGDVAGLVLAARHGVLRR